tara:strand:+ start:100 stop:1185 length:1086 start_codon:yes stop_codon:yes gene_type:complete
MRYFLVVLFAFVAIIWTIQSVNFLDLVTEDGHAFKIYFYYSLLTVPKVLTKLIPFSFLIASILTILKLEKDNELIILWTSGLNKINVVNLLLRISLLIMMIQLLLAVLVNPETLNYSRSVLKNSQLQFVPSLLKEKQFNDTVENLTIFVDEKKEDGTYKNIFIRDEGKILTQISSGSSTIFAKYGYIMKDEKNFILLDGNIQKLENDGSISIIKFEKTELNLSGLSTKTISEPKIQETSTLQIMNCITGRTSAMHNCNDTKKFKKDVKIEINKRFGMPLFIPLIALISCFLLSSRRDKITFGLNRYIYFSIGFLILILSEITVRYSGNSLNYTAIYYFVPLIFLPIVYLLLINKFKYENLT